MADDLRERLVAEAFLYDDPSAYIAGVDAALRVVRRLEGDDPLEVATTA